MSETIEDERGVADGKGSPLETLALHRGTHAEAGGDHTMHAEKQLTEDRTFFPAPGDPLNFVRSRKRTSTVSVAAIDEYRHLEPASDQRMNKKQRKCIKERDRRTSMTQAFTRLHSILMVVDPGMVEETERRKWQRATHRTGKQRNGFNGSSDSVFNRVELVNFAAALIERLDRENNRHKEQLVRPEAERHDTKSSRRSDEKLSVDGANPSNVRQAKVDKTPPRDVQGLATVDPTAGREDGMRKEASFHDQNPPVLPTARQERLVEAALSAGNVSLQHPVDRDRRLQLHGAPELDYLSNSAMASPYNVLHLQDLLARSAAASMPPNALSTLLQYPSAPAMFPAVVVPQLEVARLGTPPSHGVTSLIDYLQSVAQQPASIYSAQSLPTETLEMRRIQQDRLLLQLQLQLQLPRSHLAAVAQSEVRGVGARSAMGVNPERVHSLDGTSIDDVARTDRGFSRSP